VDKTVNKLFKKQGKLLNPSESGRVPNAFITNLTHLNGSDTIAGKDVVVISQEDINYLLHGSKDMPRNVISYLVQSSLFRGYDIIFTASPSVDGVTEGVNKYNRSGKYTTGKANIVSNIPSLSVDSIYFEDISAIMKELNEASKEYGNFPEVKFGRFIDTFLTPEERANPTRLLML